MRKLIKGQVLIELLLALVVSSLALIAMTQVATKSLANSGYSRNRSEANKYAVEATEWVRDQRDTHPWSEFSAVLGSKCLNGDLSSLSISSLPGACGANPRISGTIFSRSASFSSGQVDVTVSWNEKGHIVSSNQTIIFKQY